METWDTRSLDVQPHQPQILRSDDESRVIAIDLPAGEELTEHQVQERAYVVVSDGKIEVDGGDETVEGDVAGEKDDAHRSLSELTHDLELRSQMHRDLPQLPGAGDHGRLGSGCLGRGVWRDRLACHQHLTACGSSTPS